MEIEESELSKQLQLNERYYNCTECFSPIEILSIDEKKITIEFKCINNNHIKKLLIKEYIDKMKNFNNSNLHNDKCQIHILSYECYCLDCKIHLCKDCLKARNHLNHFKNNIVEIQPNKKELKLNILENIVNYYEDKLEKLQKENVIKTKAINDKLKKK